VRHGAHDRGEGGEGPLVRCVPIPRTLEPTIDTELSPAVDLSPQGLPGIDGKGSEGVADEVHQRLTVAPAGQLEPIPECGQRVLFVEAPGELGIGSES